MEMAPNRAGGKRSRVLQSLPFKVKYTERSMQTVESIIVQVLNTVGYYTKTYPIPQSLPCQNNLNPLLKKNLMLRARIVMNIR